MVTKIYTIDKVLMKLFQKFPGLDGVQGLKLAHKEITLKTHKVRIREHCRTMETKKHMKNYRGGNIVKGPV